jgi:hypothetical protein
MNETALKLSQSALHCFQLRSQCVDLLIATRWNLWAALGCEHLLFEPSHSRFDGIHPLLNRIDSELQILLLRIIR